MARSMTMEFSKNHFSVLAFHSSVALRSSWEADTCKWRAWTKIKRTRKSAKESCSGWERNISAWIPQCMIRTITKWNSANFEFWTPHSDNSKDMRALLFRTMLCMLAEDQRTWQWRATSGNEKLPPQDKILKNMENRELRKHGNNVISRTRFVTETVDVQGCLVTNRSIQIKALVLSYP